MKLYYMLLTSSCTLSVLAGGIFSKPTANEPEFDFESISFKPIEEFPTLQNEYNLCTKTDTTGIPKHILVILLEQKDIGICILLQHAKAQNDDPSPTTEPKWFAACGLVQPYKSINAFAKLKALQFAHRSFNVQKAYALAKTAQEQDIYRMAGARIMQYKGKTECTVAIDMSKLAD